jgi:Pvc16 N-terminal domain
MSAYTAIRAASLTLQKVLQDAINTEFPTTPPNVSLKTPKEMKTSTGVSLWLYRVIRDEFLTNQPPERISPTQQRRTPLPVRLHYLVTPLMGNDAETEQQLLGKVLQVFYDQPILRGNTLQGGLDPTTVELRVLLETLSLEEITRVWYALSSDTGYQLCVSYEVQVIEIDSALPPDSLQPVVEVDAQYNQILEVTA